MAQPLSQQRSRVKNSISSNTAGTYWYVHLREPDPATGKTKVVIHSGFNREAEAKAFRDDRKVKLRRGSAVKKDKITVEVYFAKWLPAHAQTKSLAPNTLYGYKGHIPLYVNPHIGKMPMQDVTALTISELYQKLGETLKPRTIEYTGTILRLAFRQARLIFRVIETDPAPVVPIPRPKRTPKDTWSVDELQRAIASMQLSPFGAFYQVIAATGCRKSEALGLRLTDLDLNGGVLHFGQAIVQSGGDVITKDTLKNGYARSVPVGPATVDSLRQYRKQQLESQLRSKTWHDSGLVFTNRNGGGINPAGYFYDELKRICEQAGIRYLSPHGLRHTHATMLLGAGVPLHAATSRLGHKDAMVTATTYA